MSQLPKNGPIGILYYLRLRFILLNRGISDFGLPPFLGYIFFIGLFFTVFKNILDSFEHAEYSLVLAGVIWLLKNDNHKRIGFLKKEFKRNEHYVIRVCENLFSSILFISLLIYESYYFASLMLLSITIVFSLLNLKLNFNGALKTPFGKYPFEFPIGFRKYFLLFIFHLWLIYISVWNSNLNVGLFAIIVLVFTVCMFYSNTERIYYLWIFSMNSKEFLRHKILVATRYYGLSCLPNTLMLSFFYTDEILLILGVQVLGWLYLVTVILGKYSAFPNKLNLPQTIAIFLAIWMPPLLLILIPTFYNQARRKIKFLLK